MSHYQFHCPVGCPPDPNTRAAQLIHRLLLLLAPLPEPSGPPASFAPADGGHAVSCRLRDCRKLLRLRIGRVGGPELPHYLPGCVPLSFRK